MSQLEHTQRVQVLEAPAVQVITKLIVVQIYREKKIKRKY